MNYPKNNNFSFTNQQLEQINSNLLAQISYQQAINDKLTNANDKLTGIILILLLPLIISVGFILFGVFCTVVLGINIFTWLL